MSQESVSAKDELSEVAQEAVREMPAKQRRVIAIALVVVALLSALVLSRVAGSPQTYSHTIESLDEKKGNVMALTAATVGASTALSLLPDDIGSAQATQLADLGKMLLIVLAAILLEKYLLTTFGLGATVVLIPMACLIALHGLVISRDEGARGRSLALAAKIFAVAIVLTITVPLSTFISSNIEATYDESVNEAVETAQIIEEAAQETAEEADGKAAANPFEFFQQQLGNLQTAAGNAVNAVGDKVAEVPKMIGTFTESVAVMLVLSCGVPILVLAFMLWVVRMLVGVEIPVPDGGFRLAVPRMLARGKEDSAAS